MSEVILLAGVVLVAINLRPAAASIGPLISRIERDTGLSSGWASALTTLPVLCFGALAPLAPVLAKRFGVRSSIAGAMVVLLAGIAMRLAARRRVPVHRHRAGRVGDRDRQRAVAGARQT